MSEPKPIEINDDINLKELFLKLWRGKYIVFSISVIAIALSSIYLRYAEQKYSVELVIKPVVEDSGSPNLSGFSGLASIAGISLPTSNSTDFITFQKLLFSEEVATRAFDNLDLVRLLFKDEWSSVSKTFEAPANGRVSTFKQVVMSALTGYEKKKYTPPNPKRLSILMGKTFSISLDKVSGFISISAETSRPEIMTELMIIMSRETDSLLKERFFSTSEQTLDFYFRKLQTSRSPEHREALAKLISSEDQKLMLATNGNNFVAEPLTTPSVSLNPTSPNPSYVLALGFFLGVFSSAAIVLVLDSLKPKGLLE